jgi:hypothetical protein
MAADGVKTLCAQGNEGHGLVGVSRKAWSRGAEHQRCAARAGLPLGGRRGLHPGCRHVPPLPWRQRVGQLGLARCAPPWPGRRTAGPALTVARGHLTARQGDPRATPPVQGWVPPGAGPTARLAGVAVVLAPRRARLTGETPGPQPPPPRPAPRRGAP